MSLGQVPSSSYGSYPPPHFGGKRSAYGVPQFGAQGTDGFTNSQQQSGDGGWTSTLWKGAAVIGGGLLSLKFLKPEWLKSIASNISSTISKYTPDSVIKFFEPVTKVVKAQFAEGGTLHGLFNKATNAFRGVFDTVGGFFGFGKKSAAPLTKDQAATKIQKLFRGGKARTQLKKTIEKFNFCRTHNFLKANPTYFEHNAELPAEVLKRPSGLGLFFRKNA